MLLHVAVGQKESGLSCAFVRDEPWETAGLGRDAAPSATGRRSSGSRDSR